MKRDESVTLSRVRAWILAFFLAPIRFYQRFISPGLPRRCKYEPTCSAYAVQAIRELGVIRGAILAAWRLVRCNPFSHGGIDDLCDRRLFRHASTVTHTHEHPRSV